jgi:hypothetical protein
MPAPRRSLPLFLLLAMVAAAACIGPDAIPSDPVPTGDPLPSASVIASPDGSVKPSPSADPVPTQEPAPTDTPVPSDAVSPAPSASAGAGAGVCAGNDENRVFYDQVAAAVDWPVYCPVLPAGWFVDAGEYKSAGGGWMRIAYKGPGGARLELSEGFFCSGIEHCLGQGEEAGPAPFGNLDGTLLIVADDEHAVVVDGRPDGPSWVAGGTGLSVDAFTGLVADFAQVPG